MLARQQVYDDMLANGASGGILWHITDSVVHLTTSPKPTTVFCYAFTEPVTAADQAWTDLAAKLVEVDAKKLLLLPIADEKWRNYFALDRVVDTPFHAFLLTTEILYGFKILTHGDNIPLRDNYSYYPRSVFEMAPEAPSDWDWGDAKDYVSTGDASDEKASGVEHEAEQPAWDNSRFLILCQNQTTMDMLTKSVKWSNAPTTDASKLPDASQLNLCYAYNNDVDTTTESWTTFLTKIGTKKYKFCVLIAVVVSTDWVPDTRYRASELAIASLSDNDIQVTSPPVIWIANKTTEIPLLSFEIVPPLVPTCVMFDSIITTHLGNRKFDEIKSEALTILQYYAHVKPTVITEATGHEGNTPFIFISTEASGLNYATPEWKQALIIRAKTNTKFAYVLLGGYQLEIDATATPIVARRASGAQLQWQEATGTDELNSGRKGNIFLWTLIYGRNVIINPTTCDPVSSTEAECHRLYRFIRPKLPQ